MCHVEQTGTAATWVDPNTGVRATFTVQLRSSGINDPVTLQPEQIGLLPNQTRAELADALPLPVRAEDHARHP